MNTTPRAVLTRLRHPVRRRTRERTHRYLAVPIAAMAALVAAGPDAAAAPMVPSLPIGITHYTVNVNLPGGPEGSIFYTSGANIAVPLPIPGVGGGGDEGLMITDKAGHVLWHRASPPNTAVANFRVQRYHGRKVLTWWQGTGVDGHGTGTDYLADQNYRVVRTLTAGDGLQSDAHEFRLTPDGRALITAYRQVHADLSSVGGPRNGLMMDSIASVVDVATGRVITAWSALQHVPLTDSSMRPRVGSALIGGAATYDPFHMNSIALDPSGDLLISMRNVNAVYDVDIKTGAVKWRLGGKSATLAAGSGADIYGQHDAEFAGPTTIRVFDNNVDGAIPRGPSAIKWIRIDPVHRTATLERAQTHPADLATFATGNAQDVGDGYTFGSWGTAGHISEFAPNGTMTYDASIPTGTYRAYLEQWP